MFTVNSLHKDIAIKSTSICLIKIIQYLSLVIAKVVTKFNNFVINLLSSIKSINTFLFILTGFNNNH